MASGGPTFYVDTLTALMMRPGTFFATRFHDITWVQAAAVLTVSALFCAVMGALLAPGAGALTSGLILFVNAVGMVVLGAGIAYLAAMGTLEKACRFRHLFRLFSLSWGAVLLVAWVPSAFFFTEPWKWWLIGTGMVNGLGMSKARAAIIVLFTFGATVMVIYSLLPLVSRVVGRPV